MIFKLRPCAGSGHVIVTFFSAPAVNRTFGNIGYLTMNDQEWDAMFDIMAFLTNVIIEPRGRSEDLRRGWRTVSAPFGEDVLQEFLENGTEFPTPTEE